MTSSANSQTLVLGGGRFWCTEAVYVRVRGVLDVESGYANGHADRFPRPTYEQVCSGDTGYNEVVKLVYDPQQVSMADLLSVFFAIHDPTTLNRQGHDVGSQYRSVIYTLDDTQQQQAEAMVEVLRQQGIAVVTEVQPAPVFYPAEAYHQNFFARNPNQGYCNAVIPPKLAKLQQKFAAHLK